MTTCSQPDCERQVKHMGLCSLHYGRQYKHGSANWQPRFHSRFELGRRGELLFYNFLRSRGIKADYQGFHSEYDFLVQGRWRVELKTARPARRGAGLQWSFNLTRPGGLSKNTDFYVLRLHDVPYTKAAIYLLFKGPARTKVLKISFRSLLNGRAQMAADFKKFIQNSRPEHAEAR